MIKYGTVAHGRHRVGKVFFAFIEILFAWTVVYLVILSPLDTWIKAIIGFAALILSIGLIIQAFKKN